MEVPPAKLVSDGMQFGDMRGFWGVFHAGLGALRMKLGVTPQNDGVGTANTALVYHANKLLALHEADLPYAVRAACSCHWLQASFAESGLPCPLESSMLPS